MKLSRTNGQAIVEMVLVLPLLLLLIVGAMDFGRLFFTKIVITNAAREGANYLSLHVDDKTNCDSVDPTHCYLETEAAIINEAGSSGVTVNWSEIQYAGCCSHGLPVEVKIVKPYNLIFKNLLTLMGVAGGPFHVVSTSRMVVQ